MDILLVAATPFEIAPTLRWLEQTFQTTEAGHFQRNDLTVAPLVAGIGPIATAWHLGGLLAMHSPGLALNAGIAGAFDRALPLGEVVHVTTERFGDLGVEEADGRFTDVFELGLTDPNGRPFNQGVLMNPAAGQAGFLPAVNGLTISKVHGYAPSIAAIRSKYPDAQVETMEGAAFFLACRLANVPFMEIRAVSNYVEPRNRAGWQLAPAIENLNEVLIEMLKSFDEH